MKRHDHAKMLYQILPSVYREKDRDNRDLENYMQVCGTLLDQIHQTLLQRYADNFPDANEVKPEELSSQPWLLPYFAKLLDVHLVSPTEQGQRKEIANAISWRKAKGTLQVIKQIAEAIGGYEVIVHEGWQRVAITPQVDIKLIPPTAYGYPNDYTNNNLKSPSLAARHPGLPAVTVDFQCPARAVEAEKSNPAAKVSHAGEEDYYWRQSNYHGIPCHPSKFDDPTLRTLDMRTLSWHPSKFDDPTRRTPDMRTLDWQQGHYHPRHLLLYRPVHSGFFGSNLIPLNYSKALFKEDNKDQNGKTIFTVRVLDDQIIVRNTSLDTENFRPIKIRNRVKISELVLPTNINTLYDYHWCFEGFYFKHTIELEKGNLELEKCSVFAINNSQVIPISHPSITAKDCLFNRIKVDGGKVQLTYCTVLEKVTANIIEASDCIFLGYISRGSRYASPRLESGCIRYSAVNLKQVVGGIKMFRTVRQAPVLYSTTFGEAGAGVLHPATANSIKNGAEDGTEMGAYHHLHLTQLDEVVIKKLQDFLPVGIQAVVIPDPTLNDYLSSQIKKNGA